MAKTLAVLALIAAAGLLAATHVADEPLPPPSWEKEWSEPSEFARDEVTCREAAGGLVSRGTDSARLDEDQILELCLALRGWTRSED